MNSVAEDIKDLLDAESSLDLTFQTDLFIGAEPETPNDCVTLYDVGSGVPMLSLNRVDQYFYSAFQVRVRNKSYVTGMELAQILMGTLHGRGHETWNGAAYQLIRCTSSPSLAGRDEHGRFLIVTNFEVQRREA